MLTNKTFLITGASTGLGKALAIKLAAKNANVALMARNEAKLAETAAACENNPLILHGDIRSESACQSAIQQVIAHYGHLDYLILNAGISMWSRFEDLADLTAMHELTQTNYTGAINCTYHALPHLRKTNGMIAVVSSIQGKIGVPFHSGYAASKHALEGFFNSLRMEVENKVDILLVSPGWIEGTELKNNALGAPENRPHASTRNKQTISTEVCCNEIILALLKRKREIILPKKYNILPWLKLMVPALLDKIIMKKLS